MNIIREPLAYIVYKLFPSLFKGFIVLEMSYRIVLILLYEEANSKILRELIHRSVSQKYSHKEL